MAIFGYFWANSFLVVKSKQCKHQSNVWNMFKVDNRHQNDIIDIFGRNMRGNIRSTKKKNSKKKKHSVVTNSSKSSILLQSCCLWKRNCKLMKIENGFLPLSLPISFLKCSDYMILCTKKNFRAVCYASTIDNNVFR